MKVLNRFLLITGIVSILLSLSFSVRADGSVSILWRDNTPLALTLASIGLALLVSCWFPSRFLRTTGRETLSGNLPSFDTPSAPYKIFGKMEPAVRLRMGFAVFLTFAIIGPISTLMNMSTEPVHPLTVLIATFASGAIGSSFIFFGHKKVLLVSAFILFQAMNLSAPEITKLLTTVPSPQRFDTSGSVPMDRLADIAGQRKLIGVAAIFLLSSGYIMWIVVLNKEGAKRIRYQMEVQVAREIQQRLLPSDIYTTNWCEAYGVTTAAADVGGDYFDFVRLSDDRVAIVVADVSGHGIGAGIVSTMTKSALRTQLLHDPYPVAVMNALNSVMLQVSEKKTFVTLAYVLLSRSERTAFIATAGHTPVLYRRNGGSVIELRTQSLGLGMHAQAQFHELRQSIFPGDTLVLYTDGVIEALNETADQFGSGRLTQLVEQSDGQSVVQTAEAILGSVRAFTGTEQLADDATVIAVSIT
jgi:hypothetical protein